MDNKTAALFSAWLGLDATQRSDFISAIRDYETAPSEKKSLIESAYQRADVGAYASAKCPVCGK
jgi:hypothetical protein